MGDGKPRFYSAKLGMRGPGSASPRYHLLRAVTLWLFSSQQRIGAERMTGAEGTGCEVPEAVGDVVGFSSLSRAPRLPRLV